ncbi:MAG: hypothetical protein GF393_01765, partial [Armatimonadia bacterium]|nr:hypothetical protein [Armatimonadia bacterium]
MRWTAMLLGGLFAMTPLHAQVYEAAPGPYADIVADGAAKAQIVLPAEPTFLEDFAARELQSYVERISGATLPIVAEEDAAGGGFSFVLGATNAADAAGIVPDEDAMGRDGFTMRSEGDALVIRGRNDLGTLFGVYELLERHLGVRWYMP